MNSNVFPTHSGLYVAQKGADVVLIKITGMYPTLQLGKAISLSHLISGNSLKEADKSLLNSMSLMPSEWTFSQLPNINMSAFPKMSFQPNGMLSLDYDEFISMRNMYVRMIQSGRTVYQATDAIAQKYHVPLEQVNNLINEFNKDK